MAHRLSTTPPFTCVTCEIEIAGNPTFHVGLPFCCGGCAAGGPCTCSYDGQAADPQVRHCLDIAGALDTVPIGREQVPMRERVAAVRD